MFGGYEDYECNASVGIGGWNDCSCSSCRGIQRSCAGDYERDDGMEDGCTCEPMSVFYSSSCPLHGGVTYRKSVKDKRERSGSYDSGGGSYVYNPPNWRGRLIDFYKERGFLSPKQQTLWYSITGMTYKQLETAFKKRQEEDGK